MAKFSLLDHVTIPVENVFRMRGEIAPEFAASEYEKKLNDEAQQFSESLYIHDLLLLGLGDDGHTASLFPETEALDEEELSVVANFVPKFSSHRITFTFPLINSARHVCFLVNDSKKKQIIEDILNGNSEYPAARVNPIGGKLTWLLGF